MSDVPLRVLVVDDDPMTLLTVRQVLRAAGHDSAELQGGFGFVAKLRSFEPDVVLLDLNMPGLGGIGALKSARELHKQLGFRPRVVLHSGADREELERTCEKISADGFVCKPARGSELLAAIDPDGAPADA